MLKSKCFKCKQQLVFQESILKNQCSYCRQVPMIKRKRLKEWNNFMLNATAINDEFVKRTVILNLLKNKNNFLKYGNMMKYQ